jgi:hypothetical protein
MFRELKINLEKIVSSVRNIKKAALYAATTALVAFGTCNIAKADNEGFTLPFFYSIIDDPNNPIASAEFYAIGSNAPDVSVDYDVSDAILPDDPPFGRSVLAFTDPNNAEGHVGIDYQPYHPYDSNDSNLTDNTWDIKLVAKDLPLFNPITGTANFNLTDSNALNNLPDGVLAFIQRQEPNGAPVKNYNLKETPNNSWPVTNVQNIHAKMQLKVIDGYLRARALSPANPVINFKHYAFWADKYRLQQQGPNQEDLNGNNKIDFKDLEVLTDNWLYDGN